MAHTFSRRRDFLKKWCLGTAGVMIQGNRSELLGASETEHPNILFILSDDHADRAMSCYGSKVNETRNLDRIANEGMRFTNAYVTMSLCAPSRASILTGTYPHINGQVTIGRLFNGNQVTFPKLLKAGGYQMAVIGKWHLHTEPTGFDYWNILIGQGSYFDPPMIENRVLRQYKGYTTDIITDLCLEWLDARDRTRPFCLLCHHKAPHWTCEPDEKHETMYDSVMFPEPDTFNDTTERLYPKGIDWNLADLHVRYKDHPRWQDLQEGLTPEKRKKDNYQRFMRDMLETVASLDDNVGRMLDYLEDTGLSENTIVVYASDNGYFIGEHGWIDKKVPYDESIRIPLLVRYPGRIEAGTVNEDFVLNIDFAPTLLDYAGIAVPTRMQGRSIRPLLEGKLPADWRTSFYFQYYIIKNFSYYGIRTNRYKLIYFYDEVNDWEFYDLEKDPRELNNAYNDSAYTGIIAQLKRELEHLREDVDITNEMEQSIILQNRSGEWSRELKRYMNEKMKKWHQ